MGRGRAASLDADAAAGKIEKDLKRNNQAGKIEKDLERNIQAGKSSRLWLTKIQKGGVDSGLSSRYCRNGSNV